MPDQMKIRKTHGFPVVMQPNEAYLVPDPTAQSGMIIGVTNSEATEILTTPSVQDINNLIDAKLPTPKVTFDVVTGYMPNVNDTYNVDLDNIIRITYTKLSNSGYGTYKVDLRAIDTDRVISFRRDTIYDDTSREGVNMDQYTLTQTPYASDSLVYGKMREYTRKVIYDWTSMVSWVIEIFTYGTDYVRFGIQRQSP